MPRSNASVTLLQRFCMPRWPIGAGLLGALVCAAFFSALPPMLIARTVDALERSHLHAALVTVVLYAAASLCGSVCASVIAYLGARYREDMARRLRLSIASAVYAASFDEVTALTTGEMTNRLATDVDLLSNTVQYAILPMLSAVLNLAAMVAAMLMLNVPMAVAGVLLLLLPAIPPHYLSPRIGEIMRATSAIRDRVLGAAQDTFSPAALMVLKNARAHDRELQRIRAFADAIRTNNLRITLTNAALSISANALALMGPTAILALGSLLVSRHQISVGTLVGFIAYQMRIYTPFSSISGLQVQIRTVDVILDRIRTIIDLRPERGGAFPFRAGRVTFEGVTRLGRSGPVLRDFNLSIAQGRHVALIGRSGTGKSTIAALLLRFIEPNAGRVRIGGHPVDEFDLHQLRAGVVLVTQECHLFDDTLEHNIGYGRPCCSRAEISDAISVSGLEPFVSALPNGLQTRVGQRGFNVSGGERQRIAVARALLMQPQVLILDEALTGVDLRTETAILRGIRERMKGRTLIAITHRVHSVTDFDELFILADGTIRASGSHEQLLASDGWYRHLLQERDGALTETLS